jgi:nucleoside-diphosphate-sugar epimerase
VGERTCEGLSVKAVVTGGGGFLGGRIVEQLQGAGHEVVAFQRGSYPALEKLGVRCVRGDLTRAEDVHQALEGADAVFHIAAKVGFAGASDDFERINIGGTQHVIDACQAQGVERLVYCSTPSVTLSDGHDEDVDESAPYAEHYAAHYPRTKAEAERRALAANGTAVHGGRQLRTVAIRPHLVFGPGDQNAFPRLVSRVKSGRLRIIGDGDNRIDWTYVDNASQAHLLAEEALRHDESAAAGKPYFITNGEPVNPWAWMNEVFEAVGLPPIRGKVSLGVARFAGKTLEGVWSTFGIKGEPPITEFTAVQLATSHTYKLDNARRDLGYTPAVSVDEGTERIVAWLKDEIDAGRL